MIAAPDPGAPRPRPTGAESLAAAHVAIEDAPLLLRCPDDAPVPGWVTLVATAHAAARAAEPVCAFRCEAHEGRLTWRDVRGSPAFLDLLWTLEALSATLCEVCGGPGCARERWGGWVRTLCPKHAVDVAAAGPRFADVYVRGWRSLGHSVVAIQDAAARG